MVHRANYIHQYTYVALWTAGRTYIAWWIPNILSSSYTEVSSSQGLLTLLKWIVIVAQPCVSIGKIASLLRSILTILLTCPNNDTLLCYSNDPLLTVYVQKLLGLFN